MHPWGGQSQAVGHGGKAASKGTKMGSSQTGEACLTRPTALRIRGCTMGPDLTVRGVQSASEDGPRGRSVLQHLCAGVSGGVEGSQSRGKLLILQTSSTQYPILVNPPHRADTGPLQPPVLEKGSRAAGQADMQGPCQPSGNISAAQTMPAVLKCWQISVWHPCPSSLPTFCGWTPCY